MIKLNRTTEYGLIALRHMSQKQDSGCSSVTSAREISDQYGFPFEITAKTLQKLRDLGLIASAQGARGGYTMKCELEKISLAQFLEMMEGPQSVVACVPSASGNGPAPQEMSSEDSSPKAGRPSRGVCGCEYQRRCEVKSVMSDLNERVFEFLSSIRLAEFAKGMAKPIPLEMSFEKRSAL